MKNIKKYTYLNKFHRIDGPAIIYPNGDKEWWISGCRHRLDGPALEYFSVNRRYWNIFGYDVNNIGDIMILMSKYILF